MGIWTLTKDEKKETDIGDLSLKTICKRFVTLIDLPPHVLTIFHV